MTIITGLRRVTFLYTGVISAYFQSDGHSPLSIDVLKIMYKGVQRSYDNDRRTAEGMPSGLRVNLLGSLPMNFRTSSGLMVMVDNSAVVRIFIAGKFLSSSIHTEENCWFSILAFSGWVTDSSPSVSSMLVPRYLK